MRNANGLSWSGKHLGFAVLLASALSGCNAPTAPTLTTTSTPAPWTTPSPTGSLYGVVTEMTPTGLRPVEGIIVAPLSCARVACPSSDPHIYQEVTTGKDGTYRVAGLFNGVANYIWIANKEGYISAAEPRPESCEGCDLIATVNGDTRLDIRVIRP